MGRLRDIRSIQKEVNISAEPWSRMGSVNQKGRGEAMRSQDFNGDFTKITLLARMNNGEQINISTCTCESCSNEFYVPAISKEYIPNFCPYCGIKFIKGETQP